MPIFEFRGQENPDMFEYPQKVTIEGRREGIEGDGAVPYYFLVYLEA